MDKFIFDLVDQEIPQFNKQLAEGLAYSQLTEMRQISVHGNTRTGTVNEQYINELWEQASRSFPPELKYLGYSRVSPAKDFELASARKRMSRCFYDISTSNFYMVSYKFSLHGKPLRDLNIYLPYPRRGGIITIKNAQFMISPVIADVALSVSDNSIFLMMSRTKLTFYPMTYSMFIDDVKQSIYMMWSRVYNIKDARSTVTTLPHYLFAKYGFYKAMEMFDIYREDVVVTTDSQYYEEMAKYPTDEWICCRATGRTIKSMRSNLRILIKRSKFTQSLQSVITAFFYVADIYPDMLVIEDYTSPGIWRKLLGKIILGPSEGLQKVISQTDAHISAADGYVDLMVTKALADGGYPGIENIYQLFKLLIDEGPRIIGEESENIASMYGKRFVINRYVNMDIVEGISRFLFSINKHTANKENKKVFKEKEIHDLFNKHLPMMIALRINRDHSEVKSVSSASDCLLHKVTSVTLLQTDASTSASKGPTFDLSKVLDMSISECAGHSNQPSRDPSGRSSINFCVQTDASMTILQNPKYKPMIDGYNAMIKRK